ncbi:Tyrosine kinase-like (TKL) protein [Cryptosporidium felis]|nr:Tyrosine kinase-like (TKL) protein [Cryptosporidium felis]
MKVNEETVCKSINKTEGNCVEKKLDASREEYPDTNRRNSSRCSIRMRTSMIDDLYNSLPRVVTLERNEKGQIKYNLKVSVDELINSDQYEFIKTISSGGFGVVNLCKSKNMRNVPDGKEIAVKLFTRGEDSGESGQLSDERLKSIESELNYIRIFKHPNIIEYYGILSPTTGQIGFAMEYLDGGTVFEVLYSGKNVIPLAIRKMWCLQLIKAVVYLHGECTPYRFIHRDIKTINLLIDRKDFSIRLCDFGNVRERTFSYYRLENNGGSVRYISPESLNIGSFINDKTDIWSIGCCIIEIFGGGIPYYNVNDEMRLIKMIRQGVPPEIPSFFPSVLKKICSRCLQSDPNLRPSSQHLLRNFLNIDVAVLQKSKLAKLDTHSKVD